MEHESERKTPYTINLIRSNGYIRLKTLNTKFSLAFLILNLVLVQCSETKFSDGGIKNKTITENARDIYYNGTFRTGNVLWDNILNECTIKPTVKCLQKNVYSYLDDSMGFNGDVEVTDGVSFKKNKVNISKYKDEANIIYLMGSNEETKKEFEERSFDDNEIDDDDDVSETPFEEVTDALYNKGVKFLVTHDMKMQLPDFFFNGATLKLSPRALTKTGALVHVELEPRVESNGEGRIFFKKIKKFIRKKLVMAAIAIILVIKLIALKLFFVFPVIFGVTTAKKLFLKVVLFLFPALSHIFKLCSWYHQNYHTTKFHHHHHLITHHHNKQPHGHPHPHPVYGPPHHNPPPPISYGHVGHGAVVVQQGQEQQGGTFEHYPQDWELSGPGLGSEYIGSDIHRNAINNFKPNPNDMEDINAWGLGLPPPGSGAVAGEVVSSSNNQPTIAGAPQANNQYGQQGPGRPVGPPANPYFNSNRNKKLAHKDPLQAEKEALIRAAALAARAPPSPVRDELLRVSAAKLNENNRIQNEIELVKQQQKIIAENDPETKAAEKFYGGLIDKVNNILGPMASDQGCLERAICSLYKDPFRHTPYSNLVSNELSKDSNELLPAADSKMAIRYYSYVQAARDGQENKDCLSLYPDCNIDYTKKR